MDEDYNELLDRAIDQLPEKVFETKRFTVPRAYSVIQGNRTMSIVLSAAKSRASVL